MPPAQPPEPSAQTAAPAAPQAARMPLAWPRDAALAAATGAAALAVYAATASPYVLNEDVAEFQALAAGGGIAHAGYPLLTLALEAFHRLPFATAAYRANLVSGVAGAVAVALAAWGALRLGAGRLPAAAAALALALSPALWREATRAEVYAFTLPFAAGAWLALERARRDGGSRAWLACGFLAGLALTGHAGSAAIAITAGLVAAWRAARGRRAAREALAALGGLAAGLTPLAALLLRDVAGHPLNYIETTFDRWSPFHVAWASDPATRLRRVALLLSGRQFLEDAWFRPFMDAGLRLRALGLGVALNDLPLAGTLLAAFGGAVALARRSAAHGTLALWIAATLVLLAWAAYPNVLASFFLPGLWALALFAATGLGALHRRAPAAGRAAAALLVAAPLARLAWPEPPAALEARPVAAAVWRTAPAGWSPFRHDPSWEAFGRAALAGLPPRAVVLACWDEGTTLLALTRAAGVRPDVEVRLTCDQPGRVAAAAAEAAAAGRALYATIPPARLGDAARWAPAGRWARGALWRHAP